MAGFFSKLREKFNSPESHGEGEEGYVELGTGDGEEHAKVVVRPFAITDFEQIKPILDALREGHTIALINIKPLKDKDLVELKRAINKIKKTCDAIDGDIAGFGDDWIAATPSFAKIHREKPKQAKQQTVSQVTEYSDDEA
ncbi:MAG TPA: cell division protein SepF [Candidatus Nanoarchaeia archaeon]|nr:cell division protein SepF [Candidatus Nanoarchaeia archaeon]